MVCLAVGDEACSSIGKREVLLFPSKYISGRSPGIFYGSMRRESIARRFLLELHRQR